jgi:hypothetical protein
MQKITSVESKTLANVTLQTEVSFKVPDKVGAIAISQKSD